MKYVLLTIFGFAALCFGLLGLLLPVLPTTPFVLCAAGCFGAANPSMYRKLAANRYFGEYVRNYKERSGISRTARVYALVFLWTSLFISGVISDSFLVRIFLLAVGVAVSIHIFTIRRKT